jgi:hypothetical protein
MTEGQVSLPGSGTEGKGSRKTGECGINGSGGNLLPFFGPFWVTRRFCSLFFP